MNAPSDRIVAWAQVLAGFWPPTSRDLRHGFWYPVVENGLPDRVTIIREEKPVVVPRRILDVRPRRPDSFSVVYRPGYERRPDRKSLYGLGPKYTVCPHCGQRAPIWGQPDVKHCQGCGHKGEIAWWE